ncbi:MAG TPA: 16S rRNA (cytosine(1402)-N(4))-methyltransferase RsmH [Solirubrobacteraceae bacterium]|nr:16S rRNA (cytosine(1402)-N(4))-methyltransferase RsmH [Solirubrobacteraceae bacterium]
MPTALLDRAAGATLLARRTRPPARAGAPADRGTDGGGHVPVMAGELVSLLGTGAGDTVVDCTFGDGGHARAVAERLGPRGTLIAIDRDPVAQKRFERLADELTCALRFIRSPYAQALAQLGDEGVVADAVYFDLGVSSMQVDTRERGFSYSYDAPLDMRMDPEQELTAREFVANADERQLARVLRDYGEERYATPIARAIVRRRAEAPIETTLQLVEAISAAVPAPVRFAGGHPAKRSFQALRIAVNDELGQLDAALPLAWQLLRDGGVLAAISFHSLEDRRVKRFIGELARGCVCPPELPVCVCGHEPEAQPLTPRPLTPSEDERDANPRAASAKLRAARKIAPAGGRS